MEKTQDELTIPRPEHPRPDCQRERRYKALTDTLLGNPNMFGFCYIQLCDIEQEQNGVYYYDRQPKYDPRVAEGD